jgi:hypothetical protein
MASPRSKTTPQSGASPTKGRDDTVQYRCSRFYYSVGNAPFSYAGTQQRTAHHTTQHTTQHNNTQQHTTTHNNTQQHTTTHNNTQQHTTTHTTTTTTTTQSNNTTQQQHNLRIFVEITLQAGLAMHNDLMRKLIGEFKGYEVRTEGDAFFVAFEHAADAINWALTAQEQLKEVPLSSFLSLSLPPYTPSSSLGQKNSTTTRTQQ